MGKRARGGRICVYTRIRETAPDPAYRKRLNGNKTLLDYVWDFFSERITQAIKEREELLSQWRAKQ